MPSGLLYSLFKNSLLSIGLTYFGNGSIIWSPYNISHSYDVEKVQHKFLRLAANHCGQPMPFSCHNYDFILDTMNLSTLSLINCPDIINNLSLNVPSKYFRCNELLYIEPHWNK
ncbi:hypothetical protein M0802_013100 [Mischocyttarus mexicanus]|nr:hypothetical protein M0802_013100 [Mischocyttarus mexicanus]